MEMNVKKILIYIVIAGAAIIVLASVADYLGLWQ